MPKDYNYPYSEVYVITGSSGSGKSLACHYLEGLGAHIVSADLLAKEAVKRGSFALEKLSKVLGSSILDANEELRRDKLHSLICNDQNIRETVEGILHPIIKDLAEKEFIKALEKGKGPIIYDCPLYFEKNLKSLGYKKSVLITSSEEVAVNRICKRDNISLDTAQSRLKMQMPQSEKIKLADIVIENNGTKKELEHKLSNLISNLS